MAKGLPGTKKGVYIFKNDLTATNYKHTTIVTILFESRI